MVDLPLAIAAFQNVFGTSETPVFSFASPVPGPFGSLVLGFFDFLLLLSQVQSHPALDAVSRTP
jgi:hypothetical protein